MGQVTASEFTTATGEHQYILSSSANSVEHAALRELFAQHSAQSSLQRPSTGGRAAVQYLDYELPGNTRADAQADTARLVLRHYQRGGMVALVTRRHYLWQGLPKTRAVVELGLLDYLSQQQSLRVCQPFAAQVIRSGARYQCSLLTHEIAGASTMGTLLQAGEFRAEHWPIVGKAVRALHDLQIYHADLNAHNIMLSGDAAYLIDFDRGEQRKAGGHKWKAANLKRLHRSVLKLQQQHGFGFNAGHWQALQSAYET